MGDINCINIATRILKEKETARQIERYFQLASEKMKSQDFPEAINLLTKILEIDSENRKAKTQIAYLEEIIRFNNTDVFSSTNLFMDPWEE
ncbi:MAG: hypothetical protein ABFS16_10820 [Bacteroidota bacterium]